MNGDNANGIVYVLTNPAMPAPHWTYNGKTLKEIYEETYSDEDE